MANHGQNMAILDLRKDTSTTQEPDYFSAQVAYARRFYRHSRDFEERVGYRVIAGGSETCLPGYHVERSNFPYWGIELVSSGRGIVELNSRKTALKPGSVFAYSPGMPHKIIADAVYPLKKYFVDFVPGTLRPETFPILTDLLDGRVLHSHSPEALRRSFDDLADFGQRSGEENDQICSIQINLLLMKIKEDSTEAELAQSVAYQSYRRCLEFIDNRFVDFDSIEDVAEVANMDVSYLCRLFKRFGDDTPFRRLSRLRMNHAAGLLVREGLSVSQAAIELGYEDAFTFSRRFKNVMGLSPRDFTREAKVAPEKLLTK